MMASAENDSRRAGTIWMLNLDERTPTVLPRLQAEFQRLDLDSMPALFSSIGDATLTESVTKRLESGRQCYTAWVEGQLAAYGWVSFTDEDIGELNLRMKLLAGEAYIWDCVTLPAYRQKNLYSALLAHILGELRARQLCRAWIGADLENVASQKGMARAGFHHVADLVIQRVLAVRQVWVVGLPDVPESVVAEARRAFLNDRESSRSIARSEV
jgi:ribosomal protein S18 acetylase RimI-like enzyme